MASKLIVNNLESLTNGRDITVDSIVTEQQLGLLEDDLLDRVIRVTSIAEMEAYEVPAGYVFSLNSAGRSGVFDVVAGDFSSKLTDDTENGVYVGLADNVTGSTKVAKRRIATYISPEWFGAVGNGTTNDAVALQACIDYASVTHETISLSAVVYRTTTALNVTKAVSITGTLPSPFVTSPGSRDKGSWLYFDHAGSGLYLDSGGSILGTVRLDGFGTFRNQPSPGIGWAPGTFAFDIEGNNVDLVIGDLVLLNPTKGIRLTNGDAGRLTVTGSLRGQPLLVGVDLDEQYDAPRIGMIHFWPFWQDNTNVHDYTMANLNAVILRRVDNPFIDSFFSIFARAGISIEESAAGTTSKLKLGTFEADRGLYGISVESSVSAVCTATAANFVFQGESGLVNVNAIVSLGDNFRMYIANAHISDCYSNAIRLASSSNCHIDIGNCYIRNYDTGGNGATAIEATATNSVTFANVPDIVKVGTAAIFSGAGNISAPLDSGTIDASSDDFGTIQFSVSLPISPRKVFIQVFTDTALFTSVIIRDAGTIGIRLYDSTGATKASTAVSFCWSASY